MEERLATMKILGVTLSEVLSLQRNFRGRLDPCMTQLEMHYRGARTSDWKRADMD